MERSLKILVVSDILAEGAAYAGRHRVEGLCREWARLGHEVHIVTDGPLIPRIVEGCSYHPTRGALARLWTAAPRLYTLQRRVVGRILGFLVADKSLLWYARGVRKARQVARDLGSVDFIFSSFNSATSHLVAAATASKLQIPWVADYRDAWTDDVRYAEDEVPLYLFQGRQRSKPLWLLHRSLERRALKHASLLTAISEPIARVLRAKVGPGVSVCVVPNGYDAAQVAHRAPRRREFVLSYTGKLNNSNDYRELRQVLEVLAELCREIAGAEEILRFRYWGGQQPVVQRLSRRAGVAHLVEARTFCGFEESVRVQHESTVLLLMLPLERNSEGVSSRKLFDYLAARRPIVAFVPAVSDAADIIRETRAGAVVSDRETLKDLLATQIHEFLKHGDVPYHGDAAALRRYSFANLAVEILELVPPRGGGSGRAAAAVTSSSVRRSGRAPEAAAHLPSASARSGSI